MATTRVTYKDVLEFFDTASSDLAELVFEQIKDGMDKREARRKKISENLKKARAARGGGQTQENVEMGRVDQTTGQTTGQAQIGQPAQPRQPRRNARELNNQALAAGE